MFLQSKRWKFVSAVGYGVLFALAFTGSLRVAAYFSGSSLPQETANSIFAATAAAAGAVSVLIYARYAKRSS